MNILNHLYHLVYSTDSNKRLPSAGLPVWVWADKADPKPRIYRLSTCHEPTCWVNDGYTLETKDTRWRVL